MIKILTIRILADVPGVGYVVEVRLTGPNYDKSVSVGAKSLDVACQRIGTAITEAICRA